MSQNEEKVEVIEEENVEENVEDAKVIEESENENEEMTLEDLEEKITKVVEENEVITREIITEMTRKIVDKINDTEDEFEFDHAVLTLSQVLINILTLLVEKDLTDELQKAKALVNSEISPIIGEKFNKEGGASLVQFLLTSSAIIDFIYGRKIIRDFTMKKD